MGNQRTRLADGAVPLGLLEEFAPELRRLGATNVNLYGGGEPLLHPRICEVLDLLAGEGFGVQVITNGYGLTEAVRATIARRRRHISWLRFSFHGIGEDSFARITGTRALRRIQDQIRALCQACDGPDRPVLGLFVPVTTPFERGETRSFLEWAAATGADYLWFAEDYLAPLSADGPPFRFMEYRALIEEICAEYPNLAVDYTRSTAFSYSRPCCFEEFTHMNLVWDPEERRMMLVRCPNYFPQGPVARPPEGSWEFVEPATLAAQWGRFQQRSSARSPLVCARRGACLSYRRNERILRRLREAAPADGLGAWWLGA